MYVIDAIKCVMNQPVPFGYICIYVILSIMVVACVLCNWISKLEDEVEELKKENLRTSDFLLEQTKINVLILENIAEKEPEQKEGA